MKYLTRKKADKILFSFLENIYHFQQIEYNLFKINWQQIYFLQVLKKNEISTVSETAEFLSIELFQASRLVSGLLDLNYISKLQSDKDKRSFKISITDLGSEILEKIEEYNYKVIIENTKNIDKKEIEALINALNNLKKILFKN